MLSGVKQVKRFFLLLVVLSLAFSFISPAPVSHAASQYDNVIKNTDRLLKKEKPMHESCNVNPDMSNSHLSYLKAAIQNESRSYRKQEYQKQYAVFESILDNPDSGYWAITQNSNGGLHYYFTKKEDFNKIHFSTDGVYIISKPDTKLYTFFLPSYNCLYGTLIWTSVWNDGNQYSYTTSHFVSKSSSWYLNTFPIEYPEGYEGVRLANYIAPIKPPFDNYQPPEFKICDAIDVACHLSNLFTFFKGFFSGLLKLLTHLFVPDFSRIAGYFNSAFSSVIQALGFLAYPFDFSVKAFKAMSNSFQYSGFCDWSNHAGWLINNIPDLDNGTNFSLVGHTFFGHRFSPYRSMCDVERNFPLLIKVARSFAQILIAIATISLIRRRFIQLTGGIS